MKMRTFALLVIGTLGLVALSVLGFGGTANAADGEFNLQVSPSPLVMTLKPGETTTHELKVRNVGSQSEKLRIDPRSFSIDNSGKVKFDDTKKPVEIGDWVRFSAQTFTVQPGEVFTQKVDFAIPRSAGFSYSFALVITRQDMPASSEAGRKIEAKVAIFTLLNIDKPGAVQQLGVKEFSTDQQIYEYLPAKLNVTFKNTGNTITRPSGNIFIQRGSDDKTPLSTLEVNPSEGYILPGSVRTLTAKWDNGFQVVNETTDSSGKIQSNVEWDWANLSNIRIGRYTAKLVAIYNDGQRDVPLVGEVSFWVFPWKLLLGLLIVVILLGFGIWSLVGKLFGASRTKRRRSKSVKFRS